MSLRPHALLSVLALSACGGGGGATLTLDEEVVNSRLDRLEASVPGCTTGADTMARVAHAMGDMAQTLRSKRDLAALLGFEPDLTAGVDSNGSCGGSVTVTSEHGNGNTDYVATFVGFCMSSDDGDITVDGVFEAHEKGTPSDDGPVISAVEYETAGPMEIDAAGERVTFELSGVRTEYGLPAAWNPEAPTAENPDVTTVRSASVIFHDHDGREEYISNLSGTRVGAFPAEITIDSGVLGTRGEGQVTLSTPEGQPLTVDLSGGVVNGTIVMGGKGDTEVRVSSGSSPGLMDLTLDGAAVERSVDCSEGAAVVMEAALAFYNALPIR